MGVISNISIHRKLIIIQVFTTVLVVVFCALLFTWVDFKSIKKSKEENLEMIARILGKNMVAPMLFQDDEVGRDLLEDISSEKSIQNVVIVNHSGVEFVSYNRIPQSTHHFDSLRKSAKKIINIDAYIYVKQAMYSENDLIGYLYLKSDTKEISLHFWNRLNTTLVVVLLGLLIAYILASIFQRYISQPVMELERVMGKVIRTKDYSQRSKMYGKDEIGRMAVAFNKMLEQIQSHDKLLTETNSLLEQRVDERTSELKENNLRLITAVQQAEEMRIAKEHFLASMSHEIRTPLNAIIGFQELLKETKLDERQKEFLQSVDFASRNLLVIINDILDLSKIEAGKLKLEVTDINLNEVISSVLDLVENKAKEKGLELIASIDSSLPGIIQGDPARLSQILLNLLSNSVKFTNTGFVKLSAELADVDENMVTIDFKIQDSGIGIAKENLETIFDRFTQVGDQSENRHSGTGLGLAIVKELVEIQGGKVYVESELGHGSTFSIHISFNKSEGGKVEDGLTQSNAPEKTKRSIEGLHVLLVEDIDFNQQLIKNIMDHWNCTLDIASNGKEALDLLEGNSYDVILMDIQMPVMDGYETTKRIRDNKDPKYQNVPIIALTAHASHAEADKCIKLGMNDYMSKPFRLNELKMKILHVLSNTHNKEVLPPAEEFSTTDEMSLYDLSRLKENAEGDKEFLEDILTEFINSSEEKLRELEELITRRDYKELKRPAHSLKGIVLTVGMRKTADVIIRMEELIKHEKSWKEIAELLLIIKSQFESARKGIIEEMKNL